MAARVKAIGEPWKGFFDASELSEAMTGMGFTSVTDFDARVLHRGYGGVQPVRPDTASRARLMRGLIS